MISGWLRVVPCRAVSCCMALLNVPVQACRFSSDFNACRFRRFREAVAVQPVRVSVPGMSACHVMVRNMQLSCLHLLSRTWSLQLGSMNMLPCRHVTGSEGPSMSGASACQASQACQRVRRVSVSGGSRFCVGTVQGCGSDGSCLVGAFLKIPKVMIWSAT